MSETADATATPSQVEPITSDSTQTSIPDNGGALSGAPTLAGPSALDSVPPRPETTQNPDGSVTMNNYTAPPEPVTPTQPGTWMRIVQGALAGLQGIQPHGRSSIINGVVEGAHGAQVAQQQAFENNQRQQQQQNANAESQSNIQFQNLRAAQSMAEEARKVQEFHNLDKMQQIELAQKTAEHDVYLQDQGLDPDVKTDDTSDAAHGVMKTLGDMNGGKVPEVSVNHDPVNGKVSIYAPTPGDDAATKAAQLNFINKGRAIQGMPPITADAIRKPDVRAAAFHDAFEVTNPVPTDVNKNNVVTMLNNTQQQRDRWAKAHPDDDATLKQLDNRIAMLKSSQKTFTGAEATEAAGKAGAEEKARLDTKNADEAAQAAAATSRFNIQPGDTPQQVAAKLPPTLQKAIQGLTNYEVNPKTFPARLPSGKGGAGSSQVDQQTAIGLAKMIDPTYDDTQYNARNQMRQDYTSGKPGTTGGNVRAINTAVHHMAELNDSQGKLASFGFDSANYVKNKLTPGFLKASAQVPTQEDINAVTSEVANVFAGKGATDPELDTWKKGISINSTHAEFESWIKEGMKLMAGRADAIKGGWEAGMGKPYDFSLIYPATKDALKTIPGGDVLAGSLGVHAGGANNLSPAASAFVNKYKPQGQ